MAVGFCAVCACLRAVHTTALTNANVYRRRSLRSNQISTIANVAFARLTALQFLYERGRRLSLRRTSALDKFEQIARAAEF